MQSQVELLKLGKYYLDKKEFNKAKNIFSQMISTWPDACSYQWYGSALHYNKEYIQAIKHFDIAIEKEPHNACLYFLRGKSQECIGNDSEALINYRKAVELYPYAHSYRYKYATLCHRKEYFDEALIHYEKALELHTEPDRAKAHYHLGKAQLHYRLKQFALSVKHYEQALGSGFIYDHAFYSECANAFLKNDQPLLAKQYFEKAKEALEQIPQNTFHYYVSMAIYHANSNSDLEYARQCLNKAIELTKETPASSIAWYNLGCLYLKEGSPLNALHAYCACLLLNPQYPRAYNGIYSCVLKMKPDINLEKLDIITLYKLILKHPEERYKSRLLVKLLSNEHPLGRYFLSLESTTKEMVLSILQSIPDKATRDELLHRACDIKTDKLFEICNKKRLKLWFFGSTTQSILQLKSTQPSEKNMEFIKILNNDKPMQNKIEKLLHYMQNVQGYAMHGILIRKYIIHLKAPHILETYRPPETLLCENFIKQMHPEQIYESIMTKDIPETDLSQSERICALILCLDEKTLLGDQLIKSGNPGILQKIIHELPENTDEQSQLKIRICERILSNDTSDPLRNAFHTAPERSEQMLEEIRRLLKQLNMEDFYLIEDVSGNAPHR